MASNSSIQSPASRRALVTSNYLVKDLVNNFFTNKKDELHKGKARHGAMCKLCLIPLMIWDVPTSNSNFKRHLERKHQKDLQSWVVEQNRGCDSQPLITHALGNYQSLLM